FARQIWKVIVIARPTVAGEKLATVVVDSGGLDRPLQPEQLQVFQRHAAVIKLQCRNGGVAKELRLRRDIRNTAVAPRTDVIHQNDYGRGRQRTEGCQQYHRE